MRRIGFSTGALAKGDFQDGVELQKGLCNAIEVSALREEELGPLVSVFPSLDLTGFEFVSIHAPSKVLNLDERELVQQLKIVVNDCDGIVVHPDIISDYGLWRDLHKKVVIENMDQRKPIGRTVSELSKVFEKLPNASFCLDLGHAMQVDPTQLLTKQLLNEFGDRLAQLHISEVDIDCKHKRISNTVCKAFQRVAPLIPESIPAIIESVIANHEIAKEFEIASECLLNTPAIA